MDRAVIRPQHVAALGAELARLQRRFEELRLRLDRLPSAQPLAETSGLTARLDELTERVQRAEQTVCAERSRYLSLDAQIESLRQALEGQGRALSELVDRLAARVDTLPAETPPEGSAALEALRQGVEEAAAHWRDLDERIVHLQGRLAGTEMMLAAGSEQGVEQRLALRQSALDRRLEALEQALDDARTEAHRLLDAERRTSADQLGRLRARTGVGLTLVALLSVVLATAQWWWAQAELRSAPWRAAPSETANAPSDIIALAPEPSPAGTEAPETAPSEVFEARLQALDQVDGRLRQDAEQSRQLAAALAERLTGVEARQAETDALLQRLAGTLDALAAGLRRIEVEATDLRPAEGAPTPGSALPLGEPQSGAMPSDEPPPADGGIATPPAVEPLTESDGVEPGAAASGGPEVLTEERYVIQLIGFRSAASITPFAREHGLTDTARYLRTRLRGQSWFAVVLGDYPSEAEAAAAVTALPADLRALRPLIRRLPPGTELHPLGR